MRNLNGQRITKYTCESAEASPNISEDEDEDDAKSIM
jgi:hypothetical protein